MVKATGRFRNRKLGFKTRLALAIGVSDFEEDPLDEFEIEDEKGHKAVETGVDKDEEGEVHLQAVIASAAAYVAKATGGATSKVDRAFIPTPDSTGTIPDAEYRRLYSKGYVDPVTYIRFSDTVEDVIQGAVDYTMDEDDEDWLEEYNKSVTKSNGKSVDSNSRDETGFGPISEDDFERVMEMLEKTTDKKAPMAHVDLNSLPTASDMEDAFDDPLADESLQPLKPFIPIIYPHWKQRRIKRKGKSIIPQLDFDESNENNPYVCFRRREIKSSRKTRRSDQQNLERLLRLRNDLFAAHELMVKTRARERLKLESLRYERQVFEARVEMRELKRKLNEADGDEDLLVGRREKKRRKEEAASTGSGIRLSIRKPDPSNYSAASLTVSVDDLKLRKERAAAIQSRIDRDVQRKREADQSWDDWTDIAYVARVPATPARYWRTVEPVHGSMALSGPHGKLEALGFATQYQPALGRVRTSFRRRVGRGGRVMLDRISPGLGRGGRKLQAACPSRSDSDADEEDEEAFSRRSERFRYDSDATLDFTMSDEPPVIDDFELKHLLKRASLLRATDVESLSLDTSYLEEAYRWASQDLDKHAPPPQVVGRPPPRPHMQAQTSMGMQGANGSPVAANGSAAAYGQAQLAAAQALRVAQQQQQLKRQQAAAGQMSQATQDQLRKAAAAAAAQASTSPGQVHSALPTGQNGQWNGVVGAPENKNMVLPAGFANHLPQQVPNGMHLAAQQRLANGLATSLPNGANGLPATSRLSAPPLSNLQMAIQQQQLQQGGQMPLGHSSPLMNNLALQARPLSATSNQQPPSRPGSAQSSHQSPVLLNQGLPSPNGVRANAGGKQLNGSRSSPIAFAMQAGLKQQSPLPSGLQQQQQVSFNGLS
ncbi:Enhancer of polycomb-like protein 1 [Microbotryomycetes sp. JL201]|nr:Enhancer of polycomb-like protein 1 [Microbotryomycetes sp. JL201]